MKNRKILMIVSIVLAVALSIGGTLAYLTDNDGDVNVMTVGNVQIVQNEQQRVDQGEANSALEAFEQNKGMLPYVDKGMQKVEQDVNGWDVQMRDDDTVRNYVDKIVSVTNTGNSPAYVRTIFAFPEMGDFDTTYNASEQWFHWNGVSDTDTDPENGWIWGKDQTTEWPGNTPNWDVYENVVINGQKYDIYIATNENVIAPKATTAPSLLGIYLDSRVDCTVTDTGALNYTFTAADGTVYNLGDISNLEVLVLSQAVQAEGFDDAWDAFDSAFPIDEDGTEAIAWLEKLYNNQETEVGSPGNKNETNNPPLFSTTVTNLDEFNAALGNYDVINLANDISSGEGIEIPEGSNAIIDLNGNALSTSIDFGNEDGADIKNGTLNALFINNYDDATFSDLTINSGNAANYGVINRAGTLTLNNVDLHSAGGGFGVIGGSTLIFNSGNVDINTTSTSGRYLFYAEGAGSTIIINGGNFDWNRSQNQKRAYIYAEANTTVYVNGGTFGAASTRSGYTDGIMGPGTVIITGGTFGFDPTTWVAEGYQAVKTGDNWVVSAAN